MPRGISSVRGNRRGANAMRRGAAPSFEPETLAYVGRFSTPPSDTYKNALDQAIRRWKAASVYTLIRDLWLLCADTPADSLRNLVIASRDATTSGSPTFTALKGFSGFGASDYVSLPFDATGLTNTDGQIWAGRYIPDPFGSTLMGTGDTHGGSIVQQGVGSDYGAIRFGSNLLACSMASIALSSAAAVIGVAAGQSVAPTAVIGSQPQTAAFTSSPILANSANQVRLTAYGTMPGASAAQVRVFLSVLQTFLEDIGALV